MKAVEVLAGIDASSIPFDELMAAQRPILLKGAARRWPLVAKGLESAEAAASYLKSFYSGAPVVGFTGPPEIKGRYHYNEAVDGFNFTTERVALDAYLDRILSVRSDAAAPSFYVGSTDVDVYLPGLRAENDLKLDHPMFAGQQPLIGIWIGNRTTACAHHDMSHNMACSVVGRRRFTLFPPEEIANLYPGPLAPTPGGQVVSMVDFTAPDFERFPRFRQALAAAQVAELEPGDVLFYPALWWHQVEALEAFNVMINYWWNVAPAYMDTPQNALLLAMLSLRDRPEAEKAGWRAFFDYYVFGPAEEAAAHLPERARGNLGAMDELKARRLRAYLLQRLNR
ncbi:MAG: cupin-like domain-containing protein [Hyphomonadaceae bacterium]|nr:cupin-like domain-containing protein [Hyphomonadaceae bacterium]